MALELNLTLNNNDSIEGVKGKYYPQVEYKATNRLNLLGAERLEEWNLFTESVSQEICN